LDVFLNDCNVDWFKIYFVGKMEVFCRCKFLWIFAIERYLVELVGKMLDYWVGKRNDIVCLYMF